MLSPGPCSLSHRHPGQPPHPPTPATPAGPSSLDSQPFRPLALWPLHLVPLPCVSSGPQVLTQMPPLPGTVPAKLPMTVRLHASPRESSRRLPCSPGTRTAQGKCSKNLSQLSDS